MKIKQIGEIKINNEKDGIRIIEQLIDMGYIIEQAGMSEYNTVLLKTDIRIFSEVMSEVMADE